MKTKDIAWLAGIIEGEGSLQMRLATPRILIEMTDLDKIKRISNLSKSPIYGPRKTSDNSKDSYRVNITKKKSGWCDNEHNATSWRKKASKSRGISIKMEKP